MTPDLVELKVHVYHGKLIGGQCQQTVEDRRKRFRAELIKMMEPLGWEFLHVRQAMIFRKKA